MVRQNQVLAVKMLLLLSGLSATWSAFAFQDSQPPAPKTGPAEAPELDSNKCSTKIPNIGPVAQAERDEIFVLGAFAVVDKDFQPQKLVGDDKKPVDSIAMFDEGAPGKPPKVVRRGHNIGAILVDQNGHPVWWERNSNAATCNGTQHGETRLMISYLDFKRSTALGCHTIYTTLEPCAMCSGMMTLQQIFRTVYGQSDPGFGVAIERLQQPLIPRFRGGFPQTPKSVFSGSEVTRQIDADFAAFMDDERAKALKAGKKPKFSVTGYLRTERAHAFFKSATERLRNFKVVNPVNQIVLKEVLDMLDQDVTDYYMSSPERVQRARDKAAHPGVASFNLTSLPRPKSITVPKCVLPAVPKGDEDDDG